MSKNRTPSKLPSTVEKRTSQWRSGSQREANASTKDAVLRVEVLRRVKI